MRPAWRALALTLALALAPPVASAAGLEQRVNEFWPELDAFVTLDERSRLFLLASFARGREYASATEASWGVHYDRFAFPLPDWWRQAVPMMDSGWNLAFRVGYNRISALDGAGADENRLLGDVTLRSVPLLWGLQLADRSRFELRDIDGSRSWRYRNRGRIERGQGRRCAVWRGCGECDGRWQRQCLQRRHLCLQHVWRDHDQCQRRGDLIH